MSAREPLSPWAALGGAALFFGVAALLAWVLVFRDEGQRIEREARFMGCERLTGSLWQLQFYPGPTVVRLESSGDYNAKVRELCEKQARVRVVARERGSFDGPIRWLEGLEDLERGEEVISEEENLSDRRRDRIGGVILVTLIAGMGILMVVLAVRAPRGQSKRPAPAAHPRPVHVRPRAPVMSSAQWKEGTRPARKSDLGPSRFVKRHPLSGRILIPLAGVGLTAGGVSYLLQRQGTSIAGLGYWTYNVPLGLVLATAGLLVSWVGWVMARTRTEVFRDGLAHQTWRGELILPFRDLKTFSYGEYLQGGIDIWLMGFLAEDGQQVAVRVQPDVFREKELPKLRDELARMLADRMAAGLDDGVPWMPGVEIRRDGLYFPDSGEPPAKFSEPMTFWLGDNRCELRHRGITHAWRMDGLDFYPGFLLIQRLLLLERLVGRMRP